MRRALIVLAACGSAPPPVTSVTTSPTEAAPADIADHQHDGRAHADDASKLYVEVTSDADHGDVLRRSAAAQLQAVPYVAVVDGGGDVELHVELAALAPATCKVKIFVLRLPQHDLLALADGAAHATDSSADACVATLGTALVRDRLPAVLQQQLAAKH